MKTDKRIAEILKSTISWDVRLGIHEVSVVVKDGTVYLRGTVDSLLKRRAAEEDASMVPGVKKVENDIKVVLSTKRPDPEIAFAVKEALKWDPRISPEDIHVTVTRGVVTLTGTVDNYAAKAAASVLAGGIAGVKEVKARIGHVPSQRREDRDILEEAEADLHYSYRAGFGSDIFVKVANGIVTLSGKAQSMAARRAAEETVWAIQGVKQVANKIVVKA
jgi:osmotically-inducible protein OsmY